MELLKACRNKRVYALKGRWTITGIAKKKGKNKRVDTLRGGWPRIGIAKRVQKFEGLGIKGQVDTDRNWPKVCKNKRVYALRGGWTLTGIATKRRVAHKMMH